MKKSLALIIFTALSLSLAGNVSAQVGITSVPFLQIEPDSRAAGMGNTGVAIADNASAVFWNPAGLAFQRGTQISITHSEWLPKFNADLFYDYLVGKHHVENIGTFGAHITYLNLGEQIRTNETGIEQGRFNSYEFAGGLSYGLQLNDNWSLGTGFRFIYSSLADGDVSGQKINPGSSIGVDVATMFKSDRFLLLGQEANINAGLNLSNIGPGVTYTDNAQKDPLPTILRFGWSFTTELDKEGINTLTIANDISKVMARSDSTGSDGALEALITSWNSYEREVGDGRTATLNPLQQFMVASGIEYWYNDMFAIRGGYYFEDPNNGDRQFFTVGAGIRYDFIGVDFSYIATPTNDHPLANTTRFGLLLNF